LQRVQTRTQTRTQGKPAVAVKTAKQAINDKLLDHKQYIAEHGDDMPEITGWRWGQRAMTARGTSTEGDNV